MCAFVDIYRQLNLQTLEGLATRCYGHRSNNWKLWVWFEWTWQILAEAGLTSDATDEDEIESIKNFLCLFCIYEDFAYDYLDDYQSYFDMDLFTTICEFFPGLVQLNNLQTEEECLEDITSSIRKKNIGKAIVQKYEMVYGKDGKIQLLFDLVHTRYENLEDEYNLFNTPIEYLGHEEDYQIVLYEKKGRILTYIESHFEYFS